MDQIQAMAAVCEIELNNGSNCGVQAIGRCATCGRAFCLTHQAQNPSQVYPSVYTPVPGMCASCLEAVQASIRKEQEEEQEEWRAAIEYFDSGAAQTALHASGVQLVEIFRREQKFQKGFLGLGGRYIDEIGSFGRGWLVGEFQRPYQDSPQDQLIVLLDSPPSKLIEVNSYSGGYIFLNYIDYHPGWHSPLPQKWIIAVAQAVKRLVGTSN